MAEEEAEGFEGGLPVAGEEGVAWSASGMVRSRVWGEGQVVWRRADIQEGITVSAVPWTKAMGTWTRATAS
ncbi:hypothetical protein [Spirochaeta thermophila]|uniref:hypothetical protein n=1 Tax=Winmispira thermophila TaxID=154 RepID=UPI0005A1B660|nr:hypothetical protein [Spirochaeta thermophila]